MAALLLSPVRVGGLELANRIAVAPMGQLMGRGGVVQPWHLQHLGSFAASGPGVVIMEALAVEARGAGLPGALTLADDAQEAALAKLVADIRTFSSTPLGLQIVHWGRKVRPAELAAARTELGLSGEDVDAPSALPFGAGYSAPDALDGAGMARIRTAFGDAARRALRCGFDLMEIHAAHGYLLHQFMSALSNRRTDQYGGSLRNRLRYVLEVAETVRAAWPSDRALGMRINCLDYVSGEVAVDEAVALGCELKGLGYDYVCVTSGSIVERGAMPPSRPGYLVPVAERMRREAGIATMVVGYIVDPRQADAVLASGSADLIGVGRGFIDDPRWVWHAAEALGGAIVYPDPYVRAAPERWPGTVPRRRAFLGETGGGG
jgi:NADPH2 dehydrogenase